MGEKKKEKKSHSLEPSSVLRFRANLIYGLPVQWFRYIDSTVGRFCLQYIAKLYPSTIGFPIR